MVTLTATQGGHIADNGALPIETKPFAFRTPM
jgi:hypothetical protein